ncbi:uncharacterized protein L969DRAFT_16888 [Mixia osmundae IAM 14324]|uniref:uncharacterized protein n=1 Tax=Mixia osmundae (strain CBS 9802 / IAM 14324 / JCM 22182 / KY 12970) TaxID=764103 RepID=UPI0004A54F56|nr:uncharacterized protein L969DRAFT_16888 [Mixia osmundae IAM 14324]KEI40220.1 hypothetical protein L969DRAFT_16888 [Mixia osmundae IAM 14324]
MGLVIAQRAPELLSLRESLKRYRSTGEPLELNGHSDDEPKVLISYPLPSLSLLSHVGISSRPDGGLQASSPSSRTRSSPRKNGLTTAGSMSARPALLTADDTSGSNSRQSPASSSSYEAVEAVPLHAGINLDDPPTPRRRQLSEQREPQHVRQKTQRRAASRRVAKPIVELSREKGKGKALQDAYPARRLLAVSTENLDAEAYPLILVTGGAGYLGSHTVLEILQEGTHGVVVIDNLGNSQAGSRVRLLAREHHKASSRLRKCDPPLYFHAADIRSEAAIERVFEHYALSPLSPLVPTIQSFGAAPPATTQTQSGIPRSSRIVCAIHFAGLKSVPLSTLDPLSYYSTNISGTVSLLNVLTRWNAKRIIFSSSAAIYGADCEGLAIKEDECLIGGRGTGGKGITNPYGRTKLMCEEIIGDLCKSDHQWKAVLLRYTNPSGNHPSGLIGEDPAKASSLLPLVSHVLTKRREHACIYGTDYDTPDGTGVRDFIHVTDLSKGHLAAMKAFDMSADPMTAHCRTYNLGTGQGASVVEIIETLSTVAQMPIKTLLAPRRPGDLGCVVSDPTRAQTELGWRAERGVVEMCRDLWVFAQKNPEGYPPTPAGLRVDAANGRIDVQIKIDDEAS